RITLTSRIARPRALRRWSPSARAGAAGGRRRLLDRAARVRPDRDVVHPHALGRLRLVAHAAAIDEIDLDQGEQTGQLRVETDDLLGPPAPLGESAYGRE